MVFFRVVLSFSPSLRVRAFFLLSSPLPAPLALLFGAISFQEITKFNFLLERYSYMGPRENRDGTHDFQGLTGALVQFPDVREIRHTW